MTPTLDPAQRRPVWDALADLFLDTDTTPLLPWRARQLAASPYTVEELEAILLDEVYPVCIGNLRGVAGVWTGFSPEWLEAAIHARLRSPLRLPARIARWRRAALRWPEWQATVAAVVALRAAPNPPGDGTDPQA